MHAASLYTVVETVVNTYAPLKVNRKVLNRFERFNNYLLFISEMGVVFSKSCYLLYDIFTDVQRQTKRQFK